MYDNFLRFSSQCFFNNMNYTNYYNKLLVDAVMDRDNYQKMIQAEIDPLPQFFHIKCNSTYDKKLIKELDSYLPILNQFCKSSIIESLRGKYGTFAQIFLSHLSTKSNPKLEEFSKWIEKNIEERFIIRLKFSSLIPFIFLNIKSNDSILSVGLNTPQTSEIISNILKDGYIFINVSDTKSAITDFKIGSPNCCVISYPINELPSICEFSKVLCVSPSIKDGSFDFFSESNWSLNEAAHNHIKQKEYLKNALEHVKVGGICVYSTHSINPFENEAVVNSVLKMKQFERKCELVNCESLFESNERSKGLTSWDLNCFNEKISDADLIESLSCDHLIKNIDYCMRFYPHQIHCAGTFVAVIKKLDEIEQKSLTNIAAIERKSSFSKVDDILIQKIIDDFGLSTEFKNVPLLIYKNLNNQSLYNVTNELMNVLNEDIFQSLKICNVGSLAFFIDQNNYDVPYIPCINNLPEVARQATKRFLFIDIDEYKYFIENNEILIDKLSDDKQIYFKSIKKGGIYIFLDGYGPLIGALFDGQKIIIRENKGSLNKTIKIIKKHISSDCMQKFLKYVYEDENDRSQRVERLKADVNSLKEKMSQLKNADIEQSKGFVSLKQKVDQLAQIYEQKSKDELEQQKEIDELKKKLQQLNDDFSLQQKQLNEKQQKIEELNEQQQSYKKLVDDLSLKYTQSNVIQIRVLHVISSENTFDLNFLNDLNTKNVQIQLNIINENVLIGYIENNESYLFSFDVVVLGGSEGWKPSYTRVDDNFLSLFEIYRKQGGSILFIHDFNIAHKNKYGKIYEPFSSYLGYKGITFDLSLYRKCRFIPGKCDQLSKYPFVIKLEFSICETHETPIYDDQYMIVESAESGKHHYYSENSEKRPGDCCIGHRNHITSDENKLFFNIIYHLSQLPK